MIRAAICDDNLKMGEEIQLCFRDCCRAAGSDCRSALFQDGGQLLYELQDGAYFDVFLLDIEMPRMNGLDLAAKLKDFRPDALIIFISSYDRYVYQSFQVQPFRFIPRRRMEEMLTQAAADVVRALAEREQTYLIAENQRILEKIPVRRILYIWQKGKYANVVKTDGTSTKIRKTLKEICDELPPDEFVWADRGHVVRIAQIERIEDSHICLKGGVKLDASLNRLAGLKQQVRAYWLVRG